MMSGTRHRPQCASRSRPRPNRTTRSSGRPPSKRSAGWETRPVLLKLLGDPSKLVQRTAAWAMRQTYSRHPETSVGRLTRRAGLAPTTARAGARRASSRNILPRWRTRPEIAARSAKLDRRSRCLGADAGRQRLWQFWFWTPDATVKEQHRRYAPGAHGEAAAGLGREQPARRHLQPRRREHPLPLQQLGAAAGASRKIASAPFADGSRWKRGSPRNSPPCWRHGSGTAAKEGAAAFAHRTPAAPRRYLRPRTPTLRQSRRRSTTASATISSRLRFSARARTALHIRCTRCSIRADPEMRRLALEAALLVRDTRFGDVNRIAGPMGAPGTQRNCWQRSRQMPEGAEVARVLNPPRAGPATAGIAGAPKADSENSTKPSFAATSSRSWTSAAKTATPASHCHATHASSTEPTDRAARRRSRSDPENSLILRKPTSTFGIGRCRRLHDARARRRRPLHQRLPRVRHHPGMDQGRERIIYFRLD